jgi:C-terminal processing protease CtpA/Prc
MKKLIVFVFLNLFFAMLSLAQRADSVKLFIDSALNIMQHNSIHANQLNWNVLRDSVETMTINATTYRDAYPALQYAFNRLDDKHGWLVFEDKDYKNPAFPPDTSRISADIKKAALKGPTIYAGRIENNYTYISIPFFGGQTPDAMKKFGQRIQDSLCHYVDYKTKGIILDLRLNAGGNMFAMLAGISNILGDGIIGKNVDSYGKISNVTAVKKNGIFINDSLFTSIDSSCGNLSKLPLAILLGPVTGSAGECVAVAFAGRPDTKLIGETTAGYVTANNGWYLPGKDNGIVLAVEYIRDINGKEYKENVKPDIEVIGGDSFFDRNNDKKIKAAVKWLKNRH